MLNLAPLMEGARKRQFVEGMLAVQILASILLFAVSAISGSIAHIFTDFYSFSCIFAFAACAATFQLQDWMRRYYFIHGKSRWAITCDFVSYVLQLAVVSLLWALKELTLSRTFVVMAVTSLAAAMMGPITDRVWPSFSHLNESWKQCRKLSRDLIVATQVRWLGVQGVFLIGTAIVGAAAAGGIRATANLAGPVYLVLNSLDNFVPIKIAEELKRSGTAAAYRFIVKAIWGGTVLFSLFILPIAVFGRPILRVLYGPAMVAFYWPMLLQLITIVIQTSAVLWFHLFRSLQDSRALLRGSAACAVASAATVYWFGHYWQASGIVRASLTGQVAIVAYCIFHWKRHEHQLLSRFPGAEKTPQTAEVLV
jgi:O-antigen/teichoic acid export membrane protein